MVEEAFRALLHKVETQPCELQTLEIKAAHRGCPERLYDTFSAFANQNEGGILLFGLDEKQHFARVGVYDPADLQRKLMEVGEEMHPVIRPILSVYTEEGLHFVAAEIPPIDLSERPCFYRARGRIAGAFVRVGEGDKPMSEYEVYRYEAYRKQIKDDLRPVEGALPIVLDEARVEQYRLARTRDRPNLAELPREQLDELIYLRREGQLTLTALLLFGIYPQAYFPQLAIVASHLPSVEPGGIGEGGTRLVDSVRIEGRLDEMLAGALAFVKRNIRTAIRINERTGQREDCPEYPLDAVREALLNALAHRDYSRYTENQPIQVRLYPDRLEIRNPGGLYGRLCIEQLGKAQPDTRNPELVLTMEILGLTENRYSGIPRICRAMLQAGHPEPEFSDNRGEFVVCLRSRLMRTQEMETLKATTQSNLTLQERLLDFCTTPRSRQEIADFLGIKSISYAITRHITPLVRCGALHLRYPDRPKSSKQRYFHT